LPPAFAVNPDHRFGVGVGVESMAHQVIEHVALHSLRSGARGYGALAMMDL
jgi:hypothetical protein